MADKKAKDKKSKDKGDGLPADSLTLSRHPAAAAAIKRIRAWAGLIAFGAVMFVSLRAQVPLFDAWARALGAGIVAVVFTWALAVPIWRHLALAEIEAARRRFTSPPPKADS